MTLFFTTVRLGLPLETHQLAMSQQKNLYTGSLLPFRVPREQLAQLVLKAKLEPLDQRVILEIRVPRETLEILDPLVQILQFLDLRAIRVILGLLDHRVSRVSKVKLEQLGLVVP
jgi:hypothetical protein